MSERIKSLRQTLKITQQSFADRLGLKRNTIANYEIGQINPSDRTITDICREFNVNEEWLRTGQGEMFVKLSRDEEIATYLGNVLKTADDTFEKRFISMLSKLSTAEWDVLEKMVIELYNDGQKEKD